MKKLLFFLLLLPCLVKAQTNPQTVWLTGVPPLTVSPTGASFSPTFRKVFGTDSLSMQLFAGITSTNFYQVYTAAQSNARFILNQNTFDQPANLRINGGASFRAFSTQRGAITGNGFNFSSSGFGQSLSINANVSGTANGDTLSSLHLSGAFVSNTGLATATITNGGGSYTNGTYTNIGVIDASSTHQGATIALATVVISGGAITSFTFPGPQYGAGYSVSDVITINASDVGGTGTGFAATVATLHTYSGVVPFDLISDSGVLFKKGVQATGLSSGTVVSGGWIGEDSGGNFVLGTPTASVAWGAITGTLSSQSDLNTALGLKANINSQAFTGTPSLPTGATGITQTSGNNTTRLATTAFVSSAISALGPFLNLGGSNQTVTQTPDFTTGLTAEGDIIITGSGGTGVAITDGISKNSLITDENASFNDGTASVIYRTYQIAFTGASGFGQTFNPATTLTAGRTITLPDASGTVALVGGAGVGTVTNVSAGLGMNFTTITTSGAVSLDTTFAKTKASALADYNNLVTSIATKQATLVSGTNIKTVNSTTLLGSGNFAVTTANTDTTATGFAPKAALIPYLTKAQIVAGYQPIGTYLTAVTGTTNRITSTGGTTPAIDISSTFEALLGKVANPLSQFASTTSAQLAGVLSDETGSASGGLAVFNRSATFVGNTVIGTPAGTAGTDSVVVKHSGGVLQAISPTFYASTSSLGGYVPTSTTVAGFALSGNVTLANLTAGTGITLTNYNGSTTQAVSINQAFTPTWTGLHTFQKGIVLSNGQTLAAWGTAAPLVQVASQTLTDNSTSAGATVTNFIGNYFGVNTAVASNATSGSKVTYTNNINAYFDAPAVGTNTLNTNNYAGYFNGNIFVNGNITAPSMTVTTGVLAISTQGSVNNFSVSSGNSAFSATSVSAYLYGGGTSVTYRTGFYGSSSSTVGSSTSNYVSVLFASTPITVATTSVMPWASNVVVNPLGTISFQSGASATNTASLYVGAASSAGTNNYTAYFNTGTVAFNGNFNLGGTLGAANQMPIVNAAGTAMTWVTAYTGLIVGTPTIVAGVGAGTGPTVSVTSNGKQLQVTVTTGTLPTGTNATVATVTLANALTYTPDPVFSSASASTALLSGASMVYMTSTGTANVTITSGSTGLTAATTYIWNIAL